MFGVLRRCQRLERRVLALERERDVLAAQHMAKAAELADAVKCIGETSAAYKALHAQCVGPAPAYSSTILKDLVMELGFSEWATPEHAEEILRELIAKYYTRAWAALAAEGRA